MKTIYAKLGDWIIVITLLHKKPLKQSMIHKKLDQEEDDEKKS